MLVANENIVFAIDERCGILQQLVRLDIYTKNLNVDYAIPDTIEGVKITSIASCFCKGHFDKITIPDSVTSVCESAFKGATVKEVVWSSSCSVIPERCFVSSSITKISNIEHVKSIGECAFTGSHIDTIEWPSGCRSIPPKCFFLSTLSKISNIEHVETIGESSFSQTAIEEFVVPPKATSIGEFAFCGCIYLERFVMNDSISHIGDSCFSSCRIKEFHWPPKCHVIPQCCFSECADLVSITIPETVDSIGKCAFENTNMQRLDLSGFASILFGPLAFSGVNKEQITPPYYMDDKEFEYLF